MDVEGYELNVLDGAEELIHRDRPVVFFEAWFYDSYQLYLISKRPGKKTKMIQWFTQRGFKVHHFGMDDYYAVPEGYVNRGD
jgi:hypothetical protein